MRLLFILALFVGVSSAQQQDSGQLLSDAIQAQLRGDYQLAITEYRQLLALRPDNIEAKVNLGAALAHVGQFDQAIAMYRSAGYYEVAYFNDEPYAHHWFEKRITGLV